MHTTVSDGTMTPQEVKDEYMKRGYSIVAFTDHEALVPHNELSDENFLSITSYEIATHKPRPDGAVYCYPTYHMNLYAKDKNKTTSKVFTMSRMWPPHAVQYLTDEMKAIDFPREYSVKSMNEVIAAAKEDGFLVSYNHPNWSLQNYEDYAELKGLWGVEFYNTGCVRTGYPDTMQPIDDLLNKGERVFPLATDDAHAGKETLHDCFGGWVMVKTDELDYDKVMTALEKGDFYSSTGPEIKELYIEDNILHVITSPVTMVEVVTDRRIRSRKSTLTYEKFTETTFDLTRLFNDFEKEKTPGIVPFFRINVQDTHGEVAKTRAFFFDEI